MAVIINEFEVVPETSSEKPAAAASSDSSVPSGPTAHELKLIIIKVAERYARIMAH